MKTFQIAHVRRIVIEHAKGQQILEIQGTCRVETYENGTIEVRAFTDPGRAPGRVASPSLPTPAPGSSG